MYTSPDAFGKFRAAFRPVLDPPPEPLSPAMPFEAKRRASANF